MWREVPASQLYCTLQCGSCGERYQPVNCTVHYSVGVVERGTSQPAILYITVWELWREVPPSQLYCTLQCRSCGERYQPANYTVHYSVGVVERSEDSKHFCSYFRFVESCIKRRRDPLVRISICTRIIQVIPLLHQHLYIHNLVAYAMQRVAAGVHLPTPWLFVPNAQTIEPTTAWAPDDRVDYCLGTR